MKRFIVALCAFLLTAPPANATTLDQVVRIIDQANGRYQWGSASLTAADCSGLVSVAQTLAMGQAPHRLGDTHTMLAGQWPGAIPGAQPTDRFVVGVNTTHMVASIDGVAIESTRGGFKVGSEAQSPWSPRFRQYHIDPGLMRL